MVSSDLQPEIDALLALQEHQGWKILMLRLEAEAENAREELVKVDPTDTKAIMGMQNAVHRLYWFQSTLVELLQDGYAEEQILEDDLEPEDA